MLASNPSAEEAEIGRSLELTGQLVWVNWLSPVSMRIFFSKKNMQESTYRKHPTLISGLQSHVWSPEHMCRHTHDCNAHLHTHMHAATHITAMHIYIHTYMHPPMHAHTCIHTHACIHT